jgi:hypothetical protein
MIKTDTDTMKTALLKIFMTGADSLSIVDRLSNSTTLLHYQIYFLSLKTIFGIENLLLIQKDGEASQKDLPQNVLLTANKVLGVSKEFS